MKDYSQSRRVLNTENGGWNILLRWSPEVSHHEGMYFNKKKGGYMYPGDGRFKIIDSQGYYASRECSRTTTLFTNFYREVTHTLFDYSLQPFTKPVLISSLGGFHWRGRVPLDHSTRPRVRRIRDTSYLSFATWRITKFHTLTNST